MRGGGERHRGTGREREFGLCCDLKMCSWGSFSVSPIFGLVFCLSRVFQVTELQNEQDEGLNPNDKRVLLLEEQVERLSQEHTRQSETWRGLSSQVSRRGVVANLNTIQS